MAAILITVHVLVSLFLIFVILLQPGKGDGMGGALGGGGSSSVFGGRGSVTFLSKVTQVCAVIFMLTSLTLAYRSSHSESVVRARRNLLETPREAEKAPAPKSAAAPAADPKPAPAPTPAPSPAHAPAPAQK
jgi:preprotein translocase subunit SecG